MRLSDHEETLLHLTTDGMENVNRLQDGRLLYKSRSHWDGDRLVTEFTISHHGSVVMWGREIRSLRPSDGTLIVEKHLETSNAESLLTLVMTRLR